MKSETLNAVFNIAKFPDIEKNTKLYKFYIQQCEELKENNIQSVQVEDFMEYIKTSKNFEMLKSSLNNIKKEYLYISQMHGYLHNERVALFSYYLASKLQLNERDLQLSLYSAMYHDIGRSNDCEDKYHGYESANKLEKLNLDINSEEMNILKTIITCHSLPDEMFEIIAKENNIKDLTRTRTLFKILKDADGLDRARLEYPYIRMDFLRSNISKSLIPLAYKIFNFYSLIKKD